MTSPVNLTACWSVRCARVSSGSSGVIYNNCSCIDYISINEASTSSSSASAADIRNIVTRTSTDKSTAITAVESVDAGVAGVGGSAGQHVDHSAAAAASTATTYCVDCNMTSSAADRAAAVDVIINASRRVHADDDVTFMVYYYGILGALTIVNLVGNSIVIAGILRHPNLRVPINYFLFSIACSDLMSGLLYPVYNVSHIEREEVRRVLGGWMLCTTTLTLYLGVQSISAFGLVGVAVTRFVSIRDPLKFSRIVTHGRVLVAVIVMWIALLLASAAFYFRTTEHNYDGICRYEYIQEGEDIVFTSVLSVLLPLLAMSVLYGFIVVEARKHVIAIAKSRGTLLSNNGQPNHSAARRYIIRKELRMVAVTGSLLGYFAFAWIPFVVYQIYTIHRCSGTRNDCEPDRYIRATVRLLLHSNSAVNFFIYAARVRDFREAFRRDLVCLSKHCGGLRCCCCLSTDPTIGSVADHSVLDGCSAARPPDLLVVSPSARLRYLAAQTSEMAAAAAAATGDGHGDVMQTLIHQSPVAAAGGGASRPNHQLLSSGAARLYSLTMTLGRDENGEVRVVEVKAETLTDSGNLITII